MDQIIFGHQVIKDYYVDGPYPIPPKDIQRIIFRYVASISYKDCLSVRAARPDVCLKDSIIDWWMKWWNDNYKHPITYVNKIRKRHQKYYNMNVVQKAKWVLKTKIMPNTYHGEIYIKQAISLSFYNKRLINYNCRKCDYNLKETHHPIYYTSNFDSSWAVYFDYIKNFDIDFDGGCVALTLKSNDDKQSAIVILLLYLSLEKAKHISNIVRKSKYNYYNNDINKFPEKFEKKIIDGVIKKDNFKRGCKIISGYLDIEQYNNVMYKNDYPKIQYLYRSNNIILSHKLPLTKYEFSALYNVVF